MYVRDCIDYQITRARPLLREFSPLINDCDELVLEFLRLMYEGQLTRGNLPDIPIGTNIFTLNMSIIMDCDSILKSFKYEGEVDVISTKDGYIFKFMLDGTYYELFEGKIFDDIIDFEMTPVSYWARIDLLPHKFELYEI